MTPLPGRTFTLNTKALWSALVLALVLTMRIRAQVGGQVGGDHANYSSADISSGARLYATHCTQCHGTTGDLVGTVDLRSGTFKSAASDQAIAGVLSSGIPSAGMPPFKFDNAEQTAIIAYLRNMKTFDSASVAVGDPARGRALFEQKDGCTTCHGVNGRSAGLAPDLGNIGTIRTPSGIRNSILDPQRAMRPINRPVRAITKDGRTLNGRRLNEDTFTVQLVDEQGRLVSLKKADLREFVVLVESSMPAYQGKLGSQEVADLVAYLVTLKGD